jgi:hypothetical protein
MFSRQIVSSGLVALALGWTALTSAPSVQAQSFQRTSDMRESFGLNRLGEPRPKTSLMCVGVPRPKASAYCASTRPCRVRPGHIVDVCAEWRLIH